MDIKRNGEIYLESQYKTTANRSTKCRKPQIFVINPKEKDMDTSLKILIITSFDDILQFRGFERELSNEKNLKRYTTINRIEKLKSTKSLI
jgi:hypothetical protein